MNRIDLRFRELRRKRKKAFIAFITAGYPNLKTTEELVIEFSRIGVDIVELGVPFSDPMADGPLIQEASQSALDKGTHLVDILDLVKRLRKKTEMPIAIMSYYNPIFCFGEERFIRKASALGVDGVIIPDLPPEEAGGFIKSANKRGLDLICFISPTTPLERMRRIAAIAKGFIYYVSLTGVTGPRKSLPADLIRDVRLAKGITSKPVCVGFGISSPGQVRQILGFADGVIVGSAIIKAIKQNLGRGNLVKRVGGFVSSLIK